MDKRKEALERELRKNNHLKNPLMNRLMHFLK